jgi:glycosyltransferase involved in cell wall biosynthesis
VTSRDRRRLSLAVVVQRYGADINGGAELHARYIAERISRHADVRVLTTCARDYMTWRNELDAGEEQINGVTVERFPVRQERHLVDFARRSERVFHAVHSIADEIHWLDSQGPSSPALVARLRRSGDEFDFVVLFSARYYHAYYGARERAEKAIMVPTAEREPALGLGIFPPIFRGVRGIMYNSFEERAMIQSLASNEHVPGVVVGVGSDVPAQVNAGRAREKFGLRDPYIVYVGRIDANKGCAELFEYFLAYLDRTRRPLDLVLIGRAVLGIPHHPRIRHLGFVPDEDKFDVMAGAELLVMPSYYESLSMVALESWALGRPVLANAHCDVLVGQCLRSNAGLYYQDSREFAGALDALLDEPVVAATLGGNGQTYFARHYAWPVIEARYLEMFERLKSDPPSHIMEPLPGWFARRRRTVPPAREVVEALPTGPAAKAS